MSDHFTPIFYSRADYAGYAVPVSEGGLGPENAREVLGIEVFHHYGVTIHPIDEGKTAAETVYRLIREQWHPVNPERSINVLDDNHTWDCKEGDHPHWRSRLRIIKNEKAPGFINIMGIPSWQYSDGAGAVWFTHEFRVPTVGMHAAEIACDLATAQKYRDEADAKRDTIRGRKSARELRSFAQSAEWRAMMIGKRFAPVEQKEAA